LLGWTPILIFIPVGIVTAINLLFYKLKARKVLLQTAGNQIKKPLKSTDNKIFYRKCVPKRLSIEISEHSLYFFVEQER
jgi:hypothetical protein